MPHGVDAPANRSRPAGEGNQPLQL